MPRSKQTSRMNTKLHTLPAKLPRTLIKVLSLRDGLRLSLIKFVKLQGIGDLKT